MTKKILSIIVSLVIIFAVAGIWHFAKSTSTVQNKWQTIVTFSATTTAAAPPQPAAASETIDSEAPDEKLIATLHGKDFTVHVTENGNPLYKNLAIELANGTWIEDLVRADGSKAKLVDELFPTGDTFELKQLLPNAAREQLVVKGRTVLTDGYGILGNYAVYRVNNTSLTELINLVTERDFSGLEGQPAQKLSATVTETMENGRLSVVYRYAAENSQYQTIIFQWNGSAFIDMSGKYKKLDEKYRP